MSNIAIKVENLGKKYLIKHEQKESFQTFQGATYPMTIFLCAIGIMNFRKIEKVFVSVI